MTVVNKSLRSGLGAMKLWTTDSGTFPVVFCASVAAVLGTLTMVRFTLWNPEVYFNKEERANGMHFVGDRGDRWRQFRFRLANIKRNPINQSHQFDDLFAKPENQGVKR
jgi:hypothetical protein